MKKIFCALLVFMAVFIPSSVLAASNNGLTGMQYRSDDDKILAKESLIIYPKDEVVSDSSIFITFDNAIVMSQEEIDKKYQFKYGWQPDFRNGMSTHGESMSYQIIRLNNETIQVKLCTFPWDYKAYVPTSKILDVDYYYDIPLVARTYNKGLASITIDANGSSISEGTYVINDTAGLHKENSTITTVRKSEESTEVTTADAKSFVSVKIGSNVMNVNGIDVLIDAPPYINEASSTMIPLRAIITAFDDYNISWDAENKIVRVINDDVVMHIFIGSNAYVENGERKFFAGNAVPVIKDGRTYIPFRAFGEALNYKSDWDADNKTAKYIK